MVKTVDGIFMGLFSVISLIGIMGNLFAIYVVIKGKLLKRRLWYYLLSLSCSDIFSFTVISPLTMVGFYNESLLHKRVLCNLQGSTMNFLMGWSLITIGFVNICKYRCVKSPMTDKKKDRRRLMIYVFVTFPISIFIAVAPIIGLSRYIHLPGRSWCEVKTSDNNRALVLVLVVAFLILCAIVVITNVATARYVRKETQNYVERYGVNGPMEETFHQRKSRVYQTTLLITVVFIVCWVPLFVLIIMQNVGGKIDLLFAKISYFFAFLQGCLNPIIYCFRHYIFKNQFKKLWKYCTQNRNRTVTINNTARSSNST